MTQNPKDAIIKTNVLNIFIQKEELRRPSIESGTLPQKTRRSLFNVLQRQKTLKTVENEENNKKKSLKAIEELKEPDPTSKYQGVIGKYFPSFMKGIMKKIGPEIDNEPSLSETVQKSDKNIPFTLEDMKFLKDTILKEKLILEHEIKEVTLQKASSIRMSFKDKYNKKWGKLRTTALAMGKMQSLKNMVKEYGTSMNLVGFSADKLEQLEEVLKNAMPDKNSSKIFLFYPNSFFLNYIWAPILLFLMFYNALIIPYNITYMTQPSDFERFLSCLFFIDICVNFFIVYEKDSILIKSPFKIAYVYIKSWFFLDVFSLIPFELLGCGINCGFPMTNEDDIIDLEPMFSIPLTWKFFTLFRILQISRAPHFKSFLNHTKDFFKIKTTVFSTLIFLIQVIFCVHITGCLWLYTAKIRLFSPNTWVFIDGIAIGDDDFSLYLRSVYWAVSTISTVGFGDLHANNEIERLMCIIVMVFGAGFFSYTIGTLSYLLVNNEGRKGKLRDKIMHMEAFTKENKFKSALKRKLKSALTYNSARTMFNQSEKNEFLKELPMNLKFEIANSMYLNLNTKFVFFKGKEQSFMGEFMPWLSPLKFNKGDIIYRKNESPMFVYFIISGRVGLLTGKYNTCFKTLVEGSYFGEIEIYENIPRISTMQACAECHLLIIPKDDYEKIMSIFPDYDKNFKETAHKKLEKINESLEKVKDLQTIKLNSQFWKKQTKNIYQLAMEEKENSLATKSKSRFSQNIVITEMNNNCDTSRPFLQKQSSIFSFMGEVNSPKSKEDGNENSQSFIGENNSQENIVNTEEKEDKSLVMAGSTMIRRSVSNGFVVNQTNPLGNPKIGKINRRKSQFFYGGGIKGLKKEATTSENKSNDLKELKEKLKKSEEITSSCENEMKKIRKSIEMMRNFATELMEKKKKNHIIVENFLES